MLLFCTTAPVFLSLFCLNGYKLVINRKYSFLIQIQVVNTEQQNIACLYTHSCYLPKWIFIDLTSHVSKSEKINLAWELAILRCFLLLEREGHFIITVIYFSDVLMIHFAVKMIQSAFLEALINETLEKLAP